MEAVLEKAKIKPAVNQFLYHAGMGPDPDGAQTVSSKRQGEGWLTSVAGIVSFAGKHNITIQAFSPTDEGNAALLSGEPYKSIGAAHKKSGLQAALRWLLQKPQKAACVAPPTLASERPNKPYPSAQVRHRGGQEVIPPGGHRRVRLRADRRRGHEDRRAALVPGRSAEALRGRRLRVLAVLARAGGLLQRRRQGRALQGLVIEPAAFVT